MAQQRNWTRDLLDARIDTRLVGSLTRLDSTRARLPGHDTRACWPRHSQMVRFGQILELRMLAANGNNDISFDYMRLSTEYSKIMPVYQ